MSNTSPYDKNGRWVEEKGRVKGAIRRIFRLSPQMKETLDAARVELPPAIKKDGNPGKRNQVRYRCAICNNLFPQKHVQVDHIDPVVPLWKTEAEMGYDELVRNIMCKKENLQVVCSTPIKVNNGKPSCHRLKTNEENFIRDYVVSRKSEISNTQELIAEASDKFKEHLAEKLKREKEKEERKLKRLEKKRKKDEASR